MALLFIDGFEHYDDAEVDDKWDFVDALNILTTGGRWGGGRGRFYANNYVHKFIPARDEIWLGYAAMLDKIPSAPLESYATIALRDENGVTQVQLHLDAQRRPVIYSKNSWGVLGTASGNLLVGNYVYLEMRVKIHATAGEVEIRINEQQALNLTNVRTKNPSATGNIRQVLFGGFYWLGSIDVNDLYIDNAQFHGNCRVRTFLPDADSATHFAWTRSAGAADYECVDEQYTNEDTDYIKSSTVGQKSAFGITTGELGVVKGIQLLHHIKATATGIRRIKPLIRSGGSDYNGPVSPVITTGYKYAKGIHETDPQDGQPWNQTKLEAAEFGLTLVDGTTTTSTTSTTTTV